MVREYSQYGYEGSRQGRGSQQDSEYYGGGDYDQQSQGERAPLEWDDRRYGQDFNQSPRQGGRSVYASGGSDRGRQSSNRSSWGQSANEFGGGSSGSNIGRSNRGSSRYGGSDYENNDYNRNESRYSSPYSESSRRRQGSEDYGDRQTPGNDWNRSQGSGEWNSQSNRQSALGGDSSYGSEFYGKSSGFRPAQSSGMSSGNYEDQNYGRAGISTTALEIKNLSTANRPTVRNRGAMGGLSAGKLLEINLTAGSRMAASLIREAAQRATKDRMSASRK